MEEFVNKIKSCWKPYDSSSREYVLIQFQKKLKEAKKVATQWAKDKKKKMTRSSKIWKKGWRHYITMKVLGI
jgi:hypothetical protein